MKVSTLTVFFRNGFYDIDRFFPVTVSMISNIGIQTVIEVAHSHRMRTYIIKFICFTYTNCLMGIDINSDMMITGIRIGHSGERQFLFI